MLTLPRSVRACAAIRAAVLEIETRKHAPLQVLVIGGTTGGVVFDKRKLVSIFATISSLAATGIPMLLPLRPERALEDRPPKDATQLEEREVEARRVFHGHESRLPPKEGDDNSPFDAITVCRAR